MTIRGTAWLTAAAERPEECQRAWMDDPRSCYVVPTGRMFDAVSVDLRLGLEAVDLLRRRRMPLGPVVLDYGAGRAGSLLPTMSRELFSRMLTVGTLHVPVYRYLDQGSFIALPGPLAMAADRCQWLAPPRRPRDFARTSAALALMLSTAADLLERADRFGNLFPAGPPVLTQADGASFMDAVDRALGRRKEAARVHG